MTRPRARGSRRRRLLIALGVVVVVLLAGVGGTALYARGELDAPSAAHGDPVTVDIAQGESVDTLIDQLASRDLIKSAFWFRLYAHWKNLGGRLEAGRFQLDPGMGASALVARLEMPPDARTIRVVIPEGLTAAQIAERVGSAGLGITAAAYLAEERTGQFTSGFLDGRPMGAPLEGMLFPDTYDVPVGATAHDLIAQQLEAFTTKALPLMVSPPQKLTPYQMLTLASIVEREARLPADRPLVAGVLYNRLARGMDLQVNSSVAYGLGITGPLTPAQIRQDTPYNTYLHAGLPPTPISNPGLASLQAAAHPAATAYLYFVTDGCGHNHYSTTAAAHDAAVQKYLYSGCP